MASKKLEIIQQQWPSIKFECYAEEDAAHRLKKCCKQLNIECKFNDYDDWATCRAYVTPEQHTLLLMMMPLEDWYSSDFEESLHEQFEIEYEYRKANPIQIELSSDKLKEFLSSFTKEAA